MRTKAGFTCRGVFFAFFFGLITLYFNPILAQNDTIINRYKNFLLDSELIDLSNLKKIEATLDTGGRWSTIDYADTTKAKWQPKEHLANIRTLALAWANPTLATYQSHKLKQEIDRSLAFWVNNSFKSPNWWHNKIGNPMVMRDILVLLRGHLNKLQFDGAMEVLHQFKIWGTGANLIWSADLAIFYGLLNNDNSLIENSRNYIIEEIKISKGEGIKPDFSFQQHGARLQIYHYGRAYLRSTVRIAWMLRNTRWALPKKKVDILVDFVKNGWQWMSRGIYTVPGTLDRAVTRAGSLKAADISSLLPLFIELRPKDAQLFETIKRDQEQAKKQLLGYRNFPFSDFTAYHTKNFSFFLKTISKRTLETESINGENLKGTLLNAGNQYVLHNGGEYYDLMPLWNWDKLPGITNFSWSKSHIIKKQFNGGTGNGVSGINAMDYAVDNGKETIKAHKVWISHQHKVICLIAGLKASKANCFTVLEQNRFMGKVSSSQNPDIKQEKTIMKNTDWVFHNGFAYMPIHNSSMTLEIKPVTGSWYSINTAGSKKIVKDTIFLLQLNHPPTPKSLSTGYVIASAKDLSEVKNMVRNLQFKIAVNNKDCQSVVFDDGLVAAAFFAPSNQHIGKYKIKVNKPCLILMDKEKLYASDPLHMGVGLRITIDHKTQSIKLPSNGSTVIIQTSKFQ